MGDLPALVATFLIGLFAAAALPAAACAADPAAEESAASPSPELDGNGETIPGIEPDETLSEQLHEDEGVIEPPPVGDSEIAVPAPDPDPGTTIVIPPPGSPGGDPTVQPK